MLDCLLVLLWVELAYFFPLQLPSSESLKQKKNTIPLSCLPKPSQTAYPISFQCKTKISLLLNFTKHCKRWKNITSSRLILGTRPRQRQKRLRKNSGKKYLNNEEKKAKNIFYEKLQTFQVPSVPMPLRTWISSTIRHVILWSIKIIKLGLKLIIPVCGINFRIQLENASSGINFTSPVLSSIIVTPSITIFFRSSSHASFLIVFSISFWSYIFDQ